MEIVEHLSIHMKHHAKVQSARERYISRRKEILNNFWVIPCQFDQARTAPSPILMKLCTLVHLYEKCLNPKFRFDLTSRGLAMEVESFGLEAKMPFFKCL